MHFNGDSTNTGLCSKQFDSLNQFSICGAVAKLVPITRLDRGRKRDEPSYWWTKEDVDESTT